MQGNQTQGLSYAQHTLIYTPSLIYVIILNSITDKGLTLARQMLYHMSHAPALTSIFISFLFFSIFEEDFYFYFKIFY
jgi:hypothetical protein